MPGFGAQLPMPTGAAGAPPDVLALAGLGLAGQMGIQQPTMAGGYLPTGFGQTPISTGAQQWDREQSFYEEYSMQLLAQFDQTLAQNLQIAEMDAAAAIQVAQTAANASAAAAGTSAAAQMAVAETNARAAAEAAQIRADAMRAVAEMDSATRLQIAELQAEVERERTAVMQYEAETGRRIQESKEFGQPINLAAYIHYMTQGPGTVTPGVLPGQVGLPQAAQAPTAPTAANAMAGLYQQGQVGGPVGVVGEGGPEVLSAVPGGLQVTPTTQPQAQTLMQQGVPGMQFGGNVGFSGGGRSQAVPKQLGINPADFGGPGQLGYDVMGKMWAHEARNRAGRGDLHPNLAARIQAGGRDYLQQASTGIQQHYGQQAEQQMPAWFSNWLGAQGGAATPGAVAGPGQPVAPGAGAPGAGAMPGGTPGVTGDQETDWQAFIDQLYGNAPAYGWSGPTTLPGIGVDIPYLPFQQNLSQWQALPNQVQQGRQSMWRALGITPETAMGMMYQAAPTGIAQPVAGWR